MKLTSYTQLQQPAWANGCGATIPNGLPTKHSSWLRSIRRTLKKCTVPLYFHDLGDSKYERGDENFDVWSNEEDKEILIKAKFSEDEVREIMEAVRTHGSRPGNPPTTQEGKVLATADGMWHVQTNFFPIICYMNRPQNTHSYEEWQEWFIGKIERDFGPKIFFEDEREEIRKDYEALVRVFGEKGLEGKA